MMKHKLIVIGYLGLKRCYLDMSREEAIDRWQKMTGYQFAPNVSEIEFDDEFGAYDLWTVQ